MTGAPSGRFCQSKVRRNRSGPACRTFDQLEESPEHVANSQRSRKRFGDGGARLAVDRAKTSQTGDRSIMPIEIRATNIKSDSPGHETNRLTVTENRLPHKGKIPPQQPSEVGSPTRRSNRFVPSFARTDSRRRRRDGNAGVPFIHCRNLRQETGPRRNSSEPVIERAAEIPARPGDADAAKPSPPAIGGFPRIRQPDDLRFSPSQYRILTAPLPAPQYLSRRIHPHAVHRNIHFAVPPGMRLDRHRHYGGRS